MTNATLGYGTKFFIHDAADVADPATFAASEFAQVGEVTEGPDDEDSVGTIDVTSHSSPGRRKEFIAELIEGGDISLTCNFDPADATHKGTDSLKANLGLERYIRIEEPGDTAGLQVLAIITSVGRTRPVQGVRQVSFTLKKTGAETSYSIS